MTDRPDQPERDELVSAAIDGEATPDEVVQVASDPALQARRGAFEAAAAVAGGPVEPPPPEAREAAIAAALAAYDADTGAAAADAREIAPVVAIGTRTPVRWLGVAAALLIAVAAGALLLRAGDNENKTTTAAREALASSGSSTFADQAGAGEAGDSPASRTPNAAAATGTSGSGATQAPAYPATTAAATIVEVGTFATVDDLAAEVRGYLAAPAAKTYLTTSPPFTCPTPDTLTATDLVATASVAEQQVLVFAGPTRDGARTIYILDSTCATVAEQPVS